MTGASRDHSTFLVCRIPGRLCAVPLRHVVETMRPLPVEPMPGVPPFVSGVALIRGRPTPVVDAAALLGVAAARPERLVTLQAAGRPVALAVGAVLGVRAFDAEAVGPLSGLLSEAGDRMVAAIGALDAELLLVLSGSRLVPDRVWAALQSAPSE